MWGFTFRSLWCLVPAVWIHLDVERAGSVWDRLPGDLKDHGSPRSDRDMLVVRRS